jgi:hypothetical protein
MAVTVTENTEACSLRTDVFERTASLLPVVTKHKQIRLIKCYPMLYYVSGSLLLNIG